SRADSDLQLHCLTGSALDSLFFFFFQAEDGIRGLIVTGVQTCALPIWRNGCGHGGAPLAPDLSSATADWRLPVVVRAYRNDSVGHDLMQSEGQALARYGYEPTAQSEDEIGRASCREREETRAGGVRRTQ